MSAGQLIAVGDAIDDTAVYLALWAQRDADRPGAADLAGNEAVKAIDKALLELHDLRSQLVSEIRQYQDDCNARIDAMIADRRAGR